MPVKTPWVEKVKMQRRFIRDAEYFVLGPSGMGRWVKFERRIAEGGKEILQFSVKKAGKFRTT